jgi:hypothetical protein
MRTGDWAKVPAIATEKLNITARAILAMQHAKQQVNRSSRDCVVMPPDQAVMAVAVKYKAQNGTINEIGAVAFSPATGQVDGTFSLNADRAQDLLAAFNTWLQDLPVNRMFLHWNGSLRDLSIDLNRTYDIKQRIYKPWLIYKNRSRDSHCDLPTAFEQTMGTAIRCEPDHAFDAALAIAAVYAATTNYFGVV